MHNRSQLDMILMVLSVTVCFPTRRPSMLQPSLARQLHDPGGIVPGPSPPRSLGTALARQRSHSTALSQPVSLSRALVLLRSRCAALLLGHALAASLTRWMRVRPALLLGRALPGLDSRSSPLLPPHPSPSPSPHAAGSTRRPTLTRTRQ